MAKNPVSSSCDSQPVPRTRVIGQVLFLLKLMFDLPNEYLIGSDIRGTSVSVCACESEKMRCEEESRREGEGGERGR